MVRVRFRGRFRCQLIIDSWLPVHDTRPYYYYYYYYQVVAAYAGPSRRQPRLRLQLVARQVRRLDPWNAGPTDRR